MKHRLVLLAAVLALSACSSGTAETTEPLPPPTRAAGCDNVAYIIPSSSDATLTMAKVYTSLQDAKPEIVGMQFDATLLQITREGGFDLITVQFSGELGLILFVQEPGGVIQIGWEGPASRQDEIRAHITDAYPELPGDVVTCHDLSYFTTA